MTCKCVFLASLLCLSFVLISHFFHKNYMFYLKLTFSVDSWGSLICPIIYCIQFDLEDVGRKCKSSFYSKCYLMYYSAVTLYSQRFLQKTECLIINPLSSCVRPVGSYAGQNVLVTGMSYSKETGHCKPL